MRSLQRQTNALAIPHFPININWQKGEKLCFNNIKELKDFLTEQGWEEDLTKGFCKEVARKLREQKNRTTKPSIWA